MKTTYRLLRTQKSRKTQKFLMTGHEEKKSRLRAFATMRRELKTNPLNQ